MVLVYLKVSWILKYWHGGKKHSQITIPNISPDTRGLLLKKHMGENIPDLNPIENLWHELKEFIHSEVKPKTK